MDIWLDTAVIDDVKKYLSFITGVTTNPTILLKSGCKDFERHIKVICQLLSQRYGDRAKVSVELTETLGGAMIAEAEKYSDWSENIIVKVPMNETGLQAIPEICDFVDVNCTACMSRGQVLLAAHLGAKYISLFWNRIADTFVDPIEVVNSSCHGLIDENGVRSAKIVVGSIRTVRDVYDITNKTVADIITIPPQFIPVIVNHPKTVETVKQFQDDWEKLKGESK